MTEMGALRDWMAANAFAILAAIYLASTVCLIALAIRVISLSRHLLHLARRTDRQAQLIDRLSKNLDEHAIACAGRDNVSPLTILAGSSNGAPPSTQIEAEAIRNEIRSLIAEMSSDTPGKPLDPTDTKE